MKKRLITEFYASDVSREWKRLAKDPFHRLEYETTIIFLNKYLPKKGLILDAGGGPGRYTILLAKKGYNMVLLDLTKENLEFAKSMIKKNKVEDKVKSVIKGNIMDLSRFKSNTFDAVICVGAPVSHIKGDSKRRKAVSELVRVAKRGAPIFIGVLGRMGALLQSVQYWPDEINHPNFKNYVDLGEDYLWHDKYYAHYFLPEELQEFLRKSSIKVIQTVGLEGIGMNKKYLNLLAKKDKKAYDIFIKAHRKLATHPAAVGMSIHILAVCKKP
jgi:ubiquinone/menaquinone biosynthesis C-methylase UbiE